MLCLLWAIGPHRAQAQGQQGSGTPYSAYGFGTLINSPQVEQAMMGGTGVALSDPFALNIANPASYPALALTDLQTSVAIRFLRFDSDDRTAKGNRMDLLGLALAIPFGQGRWGMALGITPVSDVGYRITDQGQVSEGAVTYEYSGNGGLNRGFIGLGRTLWQSNDTLGKGTKVSFGANFNYLFGSIEEARKAYYPRGTGYYNTNVVSELNVYDPMVGIGLQWTSDLLSKARMQQRRDARRKHLAAVDERKEQEWLDQGKDPGKRNAVRMPKAEAEAWRFRFGFTADLPTNLRADYDLTATNFVYTNAGAEATVDTAYIVGGSVGEVHLPLQAGIGFTVFNSRWTMTAEYRVRDWSQLRVNVEGYDQRSTLRTSSTTALGFSFRPAGDGNGSFGERIIYRAGLRYTDDYLVVAGAPLSEFGMSLGFSLPVMMNTTRSRINFGTELGERGTGTGGSVRERFAAVFIGISITPDLREQWFKKRRIE